jgi:hypothetical protein
VSLVPAAVLYVAVTIANLISMEVGHMIDSILGATPFAARRHVASVTVMDVEVIIYMAMKFTRAVVPGTNADEPSIYEPFRTVVAVGSTTIRSIIIVAVRADGFRPNSDADLSLQFGSAQCE